MKINILEKRQTFKEKFTWSFWYICVFEFPDVCPALNEDH